jgi:hypothetical protein
MAGGGAHTRQVNGIIYLLCKEHFPGLVEYAGVTGPAYSFDHYAAAPDVEDRANRRYNNKAERVKQELWVSLSRTTLLNTSYSLDILEIMNGYIMFVCRISSDAWRDMRPGQMWWLPNAVKTHGAQALRGGIQTILTYYGLSLDRRSPKLSQEGCR